MAAHDPGAAGLRALAARGPLVLASASPRRQELLRQAGLAFEVQPADLDEQPRPGESADALCERLACEKALAVARTRRVGVVLGGDTVVLAGGVTLGKPATRGEARAMLQSLAGRSHEVLSAVALVAASDGRVVSGVARSTVAFEPLSPADLEAYLDGGEWDGKAGAYAIQGQASAFAHLVTGDLDTVVGLPLRLVEELALRLTRASAGTGARPAG